MNDFHQKILEARIKQSNREWLGKRILLVVVFVILAFCGLLSMCSPSDTEGKTSKTVSTFGMYSNDAIGVSKYSFDDGTHDQPGYYSVVCTEGHGLLSVNDKGYPLAADEYIGAESGSRTYRKTTLLHLEQNDVLKARNLHSSSFRLEFTYQGEKTN